MRVPTVLAALVCAALILPAAASAAPAGWDAQPLLVPGATTDYLSSTPIAETAADGAIWLAWIETPTGEPTQVVVRRVSPEGQVGPLRILTTTSPGSFNGGVALARAGVTDMRAVYLSELGDRLELRRMTPLTTGAATVVYDRTVEDGDGVDNNGVVSNDPLRLLQAPGDAAWIVYRRVNNFTVPVVTARRVASDDALGPPAVVAYGRYEAAAAVNPQDGGLVAVVPGGSQGQTTALPVSTGATVGGSVVLRDSNPPLNPPSSPFAGTTAAAIGIDADGIATTGWQSDVQTFPRVVQVRRLNANTMTPLGAGPETLDAGLPPGYIQYGPLLAVDPDGGAVAGWFETTSDGSTNNALVRGLAAGALSDVGVIGPRQQLDEVGRAAAVADLIPGTGGGIVTVLEYGATTNSQADGCRVASVDSSTGGLVGAPEQLAPGNCYPQGPSDAAYGLLAAWDGTDGAARVLRKPDAAPVCSDGGPVSVVAGASVALPLACSGWRPARVVTGAPARGTVGAVDDGAGTVTYTAGAAAGSDTVRFRASNAAGQSDEAVVAVTVTPAPVVPDGSGGGGAAGGGGPGTGGAGASVADRTAPVVSGVSVSPKRVRLARPRTPSVRFQLSEAATVTVTVERLVAGRRSGARCVPVSARRVVPRRSRCRAAVRVSRVTRSVGAGARSLPVALRRGKRAPVAGSYRVTVVARDAAGNTGAAPGAKLSVVAR